MASVLIVDDTAREAVTKLLAFAAQPEHHYHPGPTAKTPGDDPNYVVTLGTYRCVFTYTQVPDGLYRHLSVSVRAKGRWPLPEAILIIGELFGFQGDFKSWRMNYVDEGQAIIVAQKTDVPP